MRAVESSRTGYGMSGSKAIAAALAVGLLAGAFWASPASAVVQRPGADRVFSQQSVPRGITSSGSGYELRSVRVVRRVRTPHGHNFPVHVTYPQLSGGKALWRNRFNSAVVAGVKRIWRDQAASVDMYDGECKDMAAMHGGWSGGFVNKRYASVLVDWDSGYCGGVSWDSRFASVTISLATGKLHTLKYMMTKLGGRASWDAAGAVVSRQRSGLSCSDGWSSVTPYKPAGWRVGSKALYLAFARYQIGYGACGSPTYQLSWVDYRAELAYH